MAAGRGKNNVLDFQKFRAARERARLPLLDAADERKVVPIGEARPLTARQIEHREQMLRYLTGG